MIIGKNKRFLTFLLLSCSSVLTGAEAKTAENVSSGVVAKSTVDSFEKLFGVSHGKRRNHTKGFCFVGDLSPLDPGIKAYSSSPLFKYPSKVVGRLSHKGGNLNAADHKPAEYGMALSLINKHTGPHFMSMNTLDFFPVSTPEDFAALMQAKATGKPAVKAFLKNSPELQRFKAHEAQKDKTLLPYEASTYKSINSFFLINEQGKKTAVRWSFEPVTKQQIVLTPEQDFFFENMQKNLQKGEIAWNMKVIFAEPKDNISNAAIPWSEDNQSILAARLTVSGISTEENGNCRDINFDPLMLSKGFAPSDDPILHARRPSYAISFGRRISEKSR